MSQANTPVVPNPVCCSNPEGCARAYTPICPVAKFNNDAVDRAAVKMKTKLAISAGKGRGGWETASPEQLQQLLAEHVKKGDPVDVMNLAMMLSELGYSTSPQA